MLVALVNGIIGLLLGLVVGVQILGLDLKQSFACVAISNFAALVSLVSTLQAERQPWMKKWILNRSLHTWTLLLVIYFGLLFQLCPRLLDPRSFLFLMIPLGLATGFSILAFGPIQDFLVRRSQRKN